MKQTRADKRAKAAYKLEEKKKPTIAEQRAASQGPGIPFYNFTLPCIPPSKNKKGMILIKGRRMNFLTKEEKAFREIVKKCVTLPSLFTGSLTLKVTLGFNDNRVRDIANYVTSLQDALNKVAWIDDSQIDNLIVVREESTSDFAYTKVEIIDNDFPYPNPLQSLTTD